MVALNLDATLIDASSRSTTLFQLSGERLEFRSCKSESADHGDTFALAPLRLAADSDDPVARFPRRSFAANAFANRAQTIRTAAADVRRIDDAIFACHYFAAPAEVQSGREFTVGDTPRVNYDISCSSGFERPLYPEACHVLAHRGRASRIYGRRGG